jgi:hypothetical protein
MAILAMFGHGQDARATPYPEILVKNARIYGITMQGFSPAFGQMTARRLKCKSVPG